MFFLVSESVCPPPLMCEACSFYEKHVLLIVVSPERENCSIQCLSLAKVLRISMKSDVSVGQDQKTISSVSYRIVFSIHDVSFSFFPLHYITLRGAFSFYTIFCVSMLQCSWLSQVLKALLKECCFLVCVSKVDTSAFLHLCMYQHDSALQRREKKPTLS